MSKYIDADAFKQELKDNYTFYGFVDLLNDFYVAIDEQPSIDIVFCKECKYDGTWKCKWRNFMTPSFPSADDFCSYGEREGE